MARKRMISPSMWESESFSELTDLAKLVFISLFSHADDDGRGKASPAYIKSMTFPNDENRRVADIKSALSEIARCMSVQFYSVDGRDYYFMTNWTEYQKIDKPTKSKLPPPPNVGVGGDIPNREQFGEGSANTRGVVDESSPPKTRQDKIIEDNNIDDNNAVADKNTVQAILGVDIDCEPKYSANIYIAVKKALGESTWAQANLITLSAIHRAFNKLMRGDFKDFVKNKPIKSQSAEHRVIVDKSAEELNAVFDELNEEL